MNQTADLTEKTLSREEKYQGSFLSLHVDQVQLPNGRTSFREVVEHVDGVAILARTTGTMCSPSPSTAM